MANVVVWADIPVTDIDRARKFYAHVLGAPVELMPGATQVAVLGSPQGMSPMDVSADLVQDQQAPSTTYGTTIYLGSNGDIDGMLARVTEAGGKILAAKQLMSDIGWIAYIKDSEGNRIGIHQPK
jgi:uncharacterized protein